MENKKRVDCVETIINIDIDMSVVTIINWHVNIIMKINLKRKLERIW